MSVVACLDQGTTSTKLFLIDVKSGEVVANANCSVSRINPQPGWMEQNAEEIYESVVQVMSECMASLESGGTYKLCDIFSLGIANQRETTVAWDRLSGKPLYNAIVWCDSRTSDLVKEYIARNSDNDALHFINITGLPLHSYFTAFKIRWLIDNVPEVRNALDEDRLMVGTVDAWLVYKLTAGRKFVTDVTNASRTMLMNIHTCEWDKCMLDFFKIPERILPEIVNSAQDIGPITDDRTKMRCVFISSILGDQQAALIGQTWNEECSNVHMVKVTYGTGAFMLWNIGEKPAFSKRGLLTTVAFKIQDQAPMYALEGAIAFAGATIDWLREKVGLATSFDECEEFASIALEETRQKKNLCCGDSCYFVPAFTGLFCPHWREDARGLIIGLEETTGKNEIMLAGFRASAYQTEDMIRAASHSIEGQRPIAISVDGGLSKSRTLLQSLADITDICISVPNNVEMMTALGAGIFACVAMHRTPCKLYRFRDFDEADGTMHSFGSMINDEDRKYMIVRWDEAVKRSLCWCPLGTNKSCRCSSKAVWKKKLFGLSAFIIGSGGGVILGYMAAKNMAK